MATLAVLLSFVAAEDTDAASIAFFERKIRPVLVRHCYRFQATLTRTAGTPIDNIVPADKDRRVQRAKLDLLQQQDRDFSQAQGDVDAIDSAIANYELAYRMQSLVPDLMDLSQETEATKRLYGIDSQNENQRNYGMECLRARRLVVISA